MIGKDSPFRALNQITERAEKEIASIGSAVAALIAQQIEHSQPDPDYQATIGSLQITQAKRDRDRQIRHGATISQDEPLRKALGADHYRMPSYLEPLAEVARKTDRAEFCEACLAKQNQEERQAWEEADRRYEDFLKAMERGEDWTAYDRLAAAAALKAAHTKELWEYRRWQIGTALVKAAGYATEDQVELIRLSPGQLHDWANYRTDGLTEVGFKKEPFLRNNLEELEAAARNPLLWRRVKEETRFQLPQEAKMFAVRTALIYQKLGGRFTEKADDQQRD
jgi:hypothetical protein